jgi:hypothetical protein
MVEDLRDELPFPEGAWGPGGPEMTMGLCDDEWLSPCKEGTMHDRNSWFDGH